MLSATAEADLFIKNAIKTDVIFCKKVSGIAYDKFIGTTLDKEQMRLLIRI